MPRSDRSAFLAEKPRSDFGWSPLWWLSFRPKLNAVKIVELATIKASSREYHMPIMRNEMWCYFMRNFSQSTPDVKLIFTWFNGILSMSYSIFKSTHFFVIIYLNMLSKRCRSPIFAKRPRILERLLII